MLVSFACLRLGFGAEEAGDLFGEIVSAGLLLASARRSGELSRQTCSRMGIRVAV